jgi:hypothetical protein
MTFKHGANSYKEYKCRCKRCEKAYRAELKRRRDERKDKRDESKRLPSVTNTLMYDTMTRGEFMRLREYDTESTK